MSDDYLKGLDEAPPGTPLKPEFISSDFENYDFDYNYYQRLFEGGLLTRFEFESLVMKLRELDQRQANNEDFKEEYIEPAQRTFQFIADRISEIAHELEGGITMYHG